MMRSFISDILVRKTAVLFSDTLLGLALLQKAIALVSKESGLPLQVQPLYNFREYNGYTMGIAGKKD